MSIRTHLKRKTIHVKQISLILEEAMSTGKKSEQQRQRQYHKRPRVVVSNFPENQYLFKKPNVMSGNSMSKNEQTYENKNKKVFLIGDRHLNRIIKENFRKEFICFPGANTRQLDYYSIPILVDEKPNNCQCRCVFLLKKFFPLLCVGTEKVFIHSKPYCL